MYFLKPGIKEDPVRRWNLPDRIFFGHGACHILAKEFQERYPDSAYSPFWIKPLPGFSGNHVFMSNGSMAFDFHGYSQHENLVRHHFTGWTRKFVGWKAELVVVQKDLTSYDEMISIGMHIREPDQFLYDPRPRAKRFLDRFALGHVV